MLCSSENYWCLHLAAPSAHTPRLRIKHIRSVDGASSTFAELGSFGVSLIVGSTSLTVPHLQPKPEACPGGHLAQLDLSCTSADYLH